MLFHRQLVCVYHKLSMILSVLCHPWQPRQVQSCDCHESLSLTASLTYFANVNDPLLSLLKKYRSTEQFKWPGRPRSRTCLTCSNTLPEGTSRTTTCGKLNITTTTTLQETCGQFYKTFLLTDVTTFQNKLERLSLQSFPVLSNICGYGWSLPE